METLNEKTDQQSSIAELQEKIGIFLFYLKFGGFGRFFILCKIVSYFLQAKEGGKVDINAASDNNPSIWDLNYC